MQRERREGTTTRQMLDAPKDAYYVWVHADVWYPKMIAEKIGRADLRIVPPSALRSLRGRRVHVVVDHAAELDDAQRSYLEAARARA